MGRTTLLLWLLPFHLKASWASLVITFIGVLAAATLMAVGAVYSRGLAEGGLQHALASASQGVLNIRLTVQNRPVGGADYDSLRSLVEETINGHVSYLVRDLQRLGRGQPDLPLVINPDSDNPTVPGPVGRPFFLTEFQENTRLIDGKWPSSDPVFRENGVEMEAVIGPAVSSVMNLPVGSKVQLAPFYNDLSEGVYLNIVGIAEPVDTLAEYWMGSALYFNVQNYGDNPLIPFYVTERAFFDGMGARYPWLVGDYEWFIFVDTGVITVDNVQASRDALNGLEGDINKQIPRSTVLTLLENSRGTGLLATYQRDLTLARVPVFLFLSLVSLVVLYFLTVVVGLLAQTRSDEASRLRSRGAAPFQVAGLLMLGQGVAVLAALVLAPFLAMVVARQWLLGTINPLGADGGGIPVGLSWDMFALAAGAGLLSAAVLLVSNVGLARMEILEFLRARARPPAVPLLHRYYVDVLAVGVLGFLLWQAQGQGGLVGRALSGTGVELDPVLLLGPAVALLAAAFILLRVLPPLVRFLAWLSGLAAPSWVTFSLVRMARAPLSYGSLAVLVMLAAALGVFGAAFQSTLSRSQQEQALFRSGGDLVLTGFTLAGSQREARTRELASIPGVTAVSPLFRDSVRAVEGSVGPSLTLLGVESLTMPHAGWFRGDFSSESETLSELLVPLRGGSAALTGTGWEVASGIPVPENTRRIGVWVNADNMEAQGLAQAYKLWGRVEGADGHHRNLDMGELPIGRSRVSGWFFMEAEVPEDSVLTHPVTLQALMITGPTVSRMPPGSIDVDDVTALPNLTARPRPERIIESFEGPQRWVAFPHAGDEPDQVLVSDGAARSGSAGLRFAWIEALGGEARGILAPPGPYPLPAVGGPGFQRGQLVRVHIGRTLVPLVISGTTDFFPTITTTSRRFLIVSLEDFNTYLHRATGNRQRPGEFWVGVDDNADRGAVIASLREALPRTARIQDRDLHVDAARRDPLSGGGWNGLTFLSISALALVVAVALGAHAVVAVNNSRVDLTVTRALGFSQAQMWLSLMLERIVVTVVGLVSGGAVGYLLARWTLSFLDTTPTGRDIIPPVVFTQQPAIILVTVAALSVAAVLAVVVAAGSAARLRPSDILRNSE